MIEGLDQEGRPVEVFPRLDNIQIQKKMDKLFWCFVIFYSKVFLRLNLFFRNVFITLGFLFLENSQIFFPVCFLLLFCFFKVSKKMFQHPRITYIDVNFFEISKIVLTLDLPREF